MKISYFIKENFNTFSKSEQKIASIILKNKNIATSSSIYDFAEICDVSVASVVRFSKLVGAKGFQDFKVSLAKEQEVQSYDFEKDLDISDSIEKIAFKTTMTNIDALKITYDLIDFNILEEIVDILKNCAHIFIFGVGGSGLLALDLQYKLIRISKDVTFISDPHSQVILSKNITENDAVIAISYSGETKEVLASVKNSNTKNTISITNISKNSLQKLCNYNLYVPSKEGTYRLGAMTSRIATLGLIDIIYLSLVTKDLEKLKSVIIEGRKAVENI